MAVEFEYSPGRRKPDYLNDRSAFDVFLVCETAKGVRGEYSAGSIDEVVERIVGWWRDGSNMAGHR